MLQMIAVSWIPKQNLEPRCRDRNLGAVQFCAHNFQERQALPIPQQHHEIGIGVVPRNSFHERKTAIGTTHDAHSILSFAERAEHGWSLLRGNKRRKLLRWSSLDYLTD